MPNISVTIPEIHNSISRPVIIGVVKQVKEICKITEAAEIYFPGDIAVMQTYGSDIDGQSKERFATFGGKRILHIEVDDQFDPQSLGTTAVTQDEHIPIFDDPNLHVTIRPIYATSEITIRFKYRTPSQTEAERWAADMRMRISMLRDVNQHKANYHYGIPTQIEDLLSHIYDKREAVEGYGQTLGEYITSHMTERLTIIGDQVNKNQHAVISETQTRIFGLFDINSIPEKPQRDENDGTWTTEFSYKFHYEKPIGLNMRYPVMVHNQLLDAAYVQQTDKEVDPSYTVKSFSKSLYAMYSFEISTLMDNVNGLEPYVRIPEFDDYRIKSQCPGTGTAMMILAEVEADKRGLLNLNDLGDMAIDPDILQFIKEVEWPYVCQQYKSLIHFTLYKNDYEKSNGSLVCDNSLHISSTMDLSFRDYHHVRFGLFVDLTMVPKEAIDRLRQYPKALIKIMGSMNEILSGSQRFLSLGDKRRLTLLEFDDIYAAMTGYGYNDGRTGRSTGLYNKPGFKGTLLEDVDPRIIEDYRNKMIRQRTIQTSFIVAERKA